MGASRAASEQTKIDWLLSEIEKSDAVFLRNDRQYNGAKAASHLRSKLAWTGGRIQTARDFILGVASRSEESGRPYEIRLHDGQKEKLQRWLLERLDAHEKRSSLPKQ